MNNPKGQNDICDDFITLFTKSVQTRTGSTTSTGQGWSWLCCKY
jgi:hypothetical protein